MSADLSKETIQKEIEAKKRRLEELKQKRLQRQQRQEEPSAAAASPSPSAAPTVSHSLSLNTLPSAATAESTADILDVVNSLITASPALAQQSQSQQQLAQFEPVTAAPTPAPPKPTLLVAPQPSVTIAGVEVIKYDVAAQTNESFLVATNELGPSYNEHESKQPLSPLSPGAKSKKGRVSVANSDRDNDSGDMAELRAERDRLRTHEIELMTTVKQLKDALAQHEAKTSAAANTATGPLSQSDVDRIEHDPVFVDFFARSSTLMERMLHNRPRYDLTVDYRANDEENDSVGVRPKLLYKFTFSDPSRTVNRPVSALDWSSKFPELMLASYASNAIDDSGVDDSLSLLSSTAAQGCVLLWNVHLSSRPEYEFTADSGVLTAFFHPNHPKLILGGSTSGQLLLWDTRAKRTPVNRTSLANSHTQPLYSCRLLPQLNGSHSVLSVSSDGQVCVWLEDNWHTPVASYQITRANTGTNAATGSLLTSHTNEVTVNCLDFPGRDYHTIVFGSDDGAIHKSRLSHTQTNDSQQRSIYESINHAHAAPISSLTFQPSTAATTVTSQPLASSLYLTSSYDWTVKLWSAHSSTPIHEFDRARDYVFDAAWHPTHPSMFVSGDATGTVDLWRLGASSSGATGSTGTASDDSEAAQSLTGTGFDAPELSLNVRQAQQSAASGDATSTSTSALSSGVSGPAVSKLRWNVNGSQLSVGNSHGEVSIFELDQAVLERAHDDEDKWWEFLGHKHKNKASR